MWASTNVSDVGYDRAVTTGFMRLFQYISGGQSGAWLATGLLAAGGTAAAADCTTVS